MQPRDKVDSDLLSTSIIPAEGVLGELFVRRMEFSSEVYDVTIEIFARYKDFSQRASQRKCDVSSKHVALTLQRSLLKI